MIQGNFHFISSLFLWSNVESRYEQVAVLASAWKQRSVFTWVAYLTYFNGIAGKGVRTA